jgi:hypothetical protein
MIERVQKLQLRLPKIAFVQKEHQDDTHERQLARVSMFGAGGHSSSMTCHEIADVVGFSSKDGSGRVSSTEGRAFGAARRWSCCWKPRI